MSENEKLEELEMQIENLKGKKNYIEESIAELELVMVLIMMKTVFYQEDGQELKNINIEMVYQKINI